MRSEQEIFSLIKQIADNDERIRAVLLNGSRANPNALKDKYQDYDILFLVKDLESFIRNPGWIDVFGERIILQMPDAMNIENEDKKRSSFAWLMLFTDGNRIDLTLFPIERLSTDFRPDSLTRIIADKDNLLSHLPPSTDRDYLIRKPNEKEFSDCCNEFWWVSTYVAKGLVRKEISYAKEIFEIPVRKMFFQMIAWSIGVQHHFSVSFGKSGKNMQQYLSPTLYNRILSTWSDAGIENSWMALFRMTEIFSELARNVALALGYTYNSEEENNVLTYLHNVHEESGPAD
jgi:aminoglycoside 6-adenylyltransferase